jgi:hypothetical protein
MRRRADSAGRDAQRLPADGAVAAHGACAFVLRRWAALTCQVLMMRLPQWEFTSSAALASGVWEVSYVVDVAEHQHALLLGSTLPADVAAGVPCAASFACDGIDVTGVAPRRARASA